MNKPKTSRTGRLITRLLTFMGFATSATAFMACYGVPTDEYRSVEVPSDTLRLPADGTRAEVMPIVAEGEWHVESKPDFVTLSEEAGWEGEHGIEVTAQPNPAAQEREGMIVVSTNFTSDTVYVVQAGNKQ